LEVAISEDALFYRPACDNASRIQQWMPAILSLFGTLLVVVTTAWLNTKALSSQIDALRAETRADTQSLRSEMQVLRAEVKQSLAEFRLEIHADLTDLKHRVERLEETRGLVRP
jgi:hypothetical protein